MFFQYQTFGFIGLGMIGGSIAKTIRRIHPDSIICAYDIDPEMINIAIREGVVNTYFDQVDERFAECDIIFLCAPVSINIEYLKTLKDIVPATTLITDVGSVKTPMSDAVTELGLEKQFIGGHPMIGSEKTSYINSNEYLIENAYYFITPAKNTQFQHTAMFSAFVQGLGALAVTLSPEEHDNITASISHVPHIVAAELVHLVRRSDGENGMLKHLAAGGFKGITRIASSSPEMWEAICMNNKTNIKNLLSNMIEDLQTVITNLDENNYTFINEYFRQARAYRDSVPENSIGLFDKIHKLSVDIPDRPGTLANVLSQLAFNNISIKNVGIVYNREFEGGVLEITLHDRESCEKASEVLAERNYTVYIQ